jgi:hypothetical protein
MSTICRLERRTLNSGTVQSTLKLCNVSDTGTSASDSDRWYMRETFFSTRGNILQHTGETSFSTWETSFSTRETSFSTRGNILQHTGNILQHTGEHTSAHKGNNILNVCEGNSLFELSTETTCANNVHILTDQLTHPMEQSFLMS